MVIWVAAANRRWVGVANLFWFVAANLFGSAVANQFCSFGGQPVQVGDRQPILFFGCHGAERR